MKWKIGTRLWLVPICYWKKGENPTECRVLEEPEETNRLYLYVYDTEEKHEVYVPAERCFYDRDKAIQAARLLTQLRDLKFDDESDFLIDQILNKEDHCEQPFQFGNELPNGSLPPIKRKFGHTRTGYVAYPTHHVKRNSPLGYSGDCVKTETIYWQRYDAQKAAEAQRQCSYSVVEVQVTALKPITQTEAVS